MKKLFASLLLAAGTLLAASFSGSGIVMGAEVPAVVHYRFATIGGIRIFYREAGPAEAPAVLLLHGFPTSSHMFRNLIPALADHYRVIAPDYPGFGQSDAPANTSFAYTFAHYADLVDGLMEELHVAD